MALKFQVEVAWSEYFLIVLSRFFRFPQLAGCNKAGDLAGQACRKRNKTPCMLNQKLFVNAWFVIVALQVRRGKDLYEVLISLLVFYKKHQVIPCIVNSGAFLPHAFKGNIYLSPDDGFYAFGFCFLV